MPEFRATAPAGADAGAQLDVGQAVDEALAAVGLDGDAAGASRTPGQLARFVATLLRENDRLGLTTIRDPREAVQRHVAEPLAGWRAIAATVPDGPIAEVGSGGGAPGLPIAILAGDREVTLIEARTRRADYLRALVDDLGLRNVRVVEERGEVFAADGDEGSGALRLRDGPGTGQAARRAGDPAAAGAGGRAGGRVRRARRVAMDARRGPGRRCPGGGASRRAGGDVARRAAATLDGDLPQVVPDTGPLPPGRCVACGANCRRRPEPALSRGPRAARASD